MSDHGVSAKICANCHLDCSTRPRVKDRAGRYICRDCLNQMKATGQPMAQPQPGRAAVATAAASGTGAPSDRDVMAALLDDAIAHQPEACPHCGVPGKHGAVVCVHCGYNRQTGRTAKTKVQEAKGSKEESTVTSASSLLSPGATFLYQAIFFGLLFGVSMFEPPFIAILGLFLILHGAIAGFGVTINAARDEVLLKYLFVPFYQGYYFFTVMESGYVKMAIYANWFGWALVIGTIMMNNGELPTIE